MSCDSSGCTFQRLLYDGLADVFVPCCSELLRQAMQMKAAGTEAAGTEAACVV